MNISTGYGLALASCGELCGRPCIARRDNGGQSLRAHHGEFTARRVCRVSRPRSSSSRESRIITRGRDRKLVCGGLRRTQPRSLTHARLSIRRQIGAKSLLYLPHLVKKKKLCFSRRTKSCESAAALQKPRDNQRPRLIKSCKNRSSFMGNCGQ